MALMGINLNIVLYLIHNKMIKKIIYSLFLLVTIGCSDKTLTTANHTGLVKQLKIMSYNIHIANPPSTKAGYVDLPAIAQVIKKEKPDLVALQEVDVYTKRSGSDSHQAKDLAKMVGMNYFFAKAMDRSGGEYGVAVLSRFPILESKAIKLNLPLNNSGGENRAAALITIEINNQKIVFVGTHLDHKSDENRIYQSDQLLKQIQSYQSYPMFVAGDFNMNPTNKALDVFKKDFDRGCTTCPFTFSAVKPSTTIDYIMINRTALKEFEVVKYRTINETYASDHLPLVADLNFKE